MLPAEPDNVALGSFLSRRKAADPDHFQDLSLSVVKLLGLSRAGALAAEDDPARGTGTTVVEPVDRTLGKEVVPVGRPEEHHTLEGEVACTPGDVSVWPAQLFEVEVEAGDFMWLRAFCPQACYAGGPSRFRYLLYKDVNRHANLTIGGNR